MKGKERKETLNLNIAMKLSLSLDYSESNPFRSIRL